MKWSLVKFSALCLAALVTLGSAGQTFGQLSPAGVMVDADGILRNRTVADPSGQLNRMRANQAIASMNRDLATPSELRKVSLARLQSEMQRLLDAGQPIPPDMLYLAGLTRVTHVFCYPESGDIVLAGPAEGFFEDQSGYIRGVHSGQATMHLQDLLAALRAFPQSGRGQSVIACSIDPTPEGLARMQQFQSNVNFTSPAQIPQIAEGVRQSLGMQTVRVQGVPDTTHFAHVMVEADYRMKLIGLGLQRIQGVTAYVDRLRGGSNNALVRWFFAPRYEAIQVAENELAATLVGAGVELMTENEIVDQFGNRQAARKNANQASVAFCSSFTKNFDKIALADPIFGELRNVMDLAVLAAFIQSRDFYGLSGLTLDLLASEDKLSITVMPAVKQVESVVTALYKNGQLITPVSGGVLVKPLEEIRESAISVDTSGKTEQLRDKVDFSNLTPNQWWWD